MWFIHTERVLGFVLVADTQNTKALLLLFVHCFINYFVSQTSSVLRIWLVHLCFILFFFLTSFHGMKIYNII